MWSERLGLKGAANGGEVANSTACATVFACTPMPPMVAMIKQKNEQGSVGRLGRRKRDRTYMPW